MLQLAFEAGDEGCASVLGDHDVEDNAPGYFLSIRLAACTEDEVWWLPIGEKADFNDPWLDPEKL